jgi:hypothetical protein
MTRKDYIAIARALNGAYPIPENNTPDSAWRNCIEAVARVLAEDNPRFDHARFKEAAYGVETA